jgi:hypothetical protein
MKNVYYLMTKNLTIYMVLYCLNFLKYVLILTLYTALNVLFLNLHLK